MLLGEHAVVYGRPCLVTAIDRRIRVAVESTQDGLVHLSAPDVAVDDWTVPVAEVGGADPPTSLRFLHAIIRCVAQRYGLPVGLRIETRSEFSEDLGLGSSAAVTIAAVVALSDLLGLELSRAQLFTLGCEAVRAVQAVGSGFDVAASLYGGTLYFRPSGPEVVPLHADPVPLVVGYSGTKADTVSLISCVAQRRVEEPQLIEEVFDGMARLVEEGRQALVARDWERLGRAMRLSQPLLETLGVSIPKLAQLVRAAEEAGAYGAKLSGAGGGDCMIALVSRERRHEVSAAIEGAGGEVISVQTGAEGARREG